MNKYLEDLSYSGLVSKIQNDKSIGRDILVDIVSAFECQKAKRKTILEDLKNTETEIANLASAADSIFKHLDLKKPLAIIIPEGLALISDVSMSIERNVL